MGSMKTAQPERNFGSSEVSMKWITRKTVKVDRVACPWLIRRFIDPKAEFLFVEENEDIGAIFT